MRIGLVVGVLAGLLLAPKAGKETRDDIVIGICDLLESGEKTVKKFEKKKGSNFIIGAVIVAAAGIGAGLLLTKKTVKVKRVLK